MSERIDKGWYRNGASNMRNGVLILSHSREVRYCHWAGCTAAFVITNERDKKYCDDHAAAAKKRTQAKATAAAKARKAAGR